jgi:hypothetical protein
MEGVDAKINRAEEHLGAFKEEALAFLQSVVHKTVMKANTDEAWLVYWIEDPIPPIRLSAVIGDCVYNMRSALDNLICGLARTVRPDCACVDLKFPIFSEAAHWEKNFKTTLRGVPEDAQTIIKGLQPCFQSIADRASDPLFVLNKLSNMDKHRAILITTVYDTNLRFVIHSNDSSVHHVAVQGSIHGGSPTIIPLPIHPSKLVPKVPVQTLGSGLIALREAGPWAERPVHEVLNTSLGYLKDIVIPKLKPFFG